MTTSRSSRRDFFLSGGAAIGAGMATAAGASPQGVMAAGDHEAIRRLQQSFASHIENQAYELAAALFDEQARVQLKDASASGKAEIRQLLAGQARHEEAPTLHKAFRHNPVKPETVTISADGRRATATFHVDTQLSTPLQGESTAAQMARLQGQAASRYWESGRLEATYLKSNGHWKMASLSYLAT